MYINIVNLPTSSLMVAFTLFSAKKEVKVKLNDSIHDFSSKFVKYFPNMNHYITSSAGINNCQKKMFKAEFYDHILNSVVMYSHEPVRLPFHVISEWYLDPISVTLQDTLTGSPCRYCGISIEFWVISVFGCPSMVR